MLRTLFAGLLTSAMMAVAAPSLAHHAVQSEFDMNGSNGGLEGSRWVIAPCLGGCEAGLEAFKGLGAFRYGEGCLVRRPDRQLSRAFLAAPELCDGRFRLV